MNITIDGNIFLRESDQAYHQQAKENLSSHQLGDFRKSPAIYYQKKIGLVKDDDRPAYAIGRAAHCLTLEGLEAFQRNFAVGGPINPRTGKSYGSNTQAYADWAASQGKPVITDEQYALIQSMSASVRGHGEASDLLATGVAEAVIRTEYCGLPCQIRMDWFNPERGIVDLKTTDSLDYFVADARRYGYLFQLAFYQAVLERATGQRAPAFFIAVEKVPIYRCGVWRIDQSALDYARGQNESAVQRLQECRSTGHWPTGYELPLVFDAI